MKKLWLLLLAAGAMTFAPACTDDDDNGPSCPVKCTVPATAEIGSELTITGQGFDAAAEIALRNDSGVESKLENPQITATSYTGTVPLALTPGSYTVVLYQEGIWELGLVKLTMAADKDCPVLSITVPNAIRLNEELEIAGAGFTSDMQILLENTADQSRKELTVTLSGVGVTCTIPEGVSAGLYNVILKQGAYEWKIAESVPAAVYKRLIEISKESSIILKGITTEEFIQALVEMGYPEEMAQAYADTFLKSVLSYSFTYDTNGNLTSCGMVNPYTYASGEWYAITVNGNQISGENKQIMDGMDGMKAFSWTLENNRISQSTSFWQTASGETPSTRYSWIYNGDMCDRINNPDGSPEITFVYDEDKFMSIIQSNWDDPVSIFTYKPEAQHNCVFGVDIAKILLITQESSPLADDQALAVFLNLAGKATTILPSTIDITEETTASITYTFDKDNYVSTVEWSVPGGEPIMGYEIESQKVTYTFKYE